MTVTNVYDLKEITTCVSVLENGINHLRLGV